MNLRQKGFLNYLRVQALPAYSMFSQALLTRLILEKILRYRTAIILQYSLLQIIFLFFPTAYAADQVDDKAILQFKSYLREIKSIAVDFSQTDSQGSEAKGQLLINKPYKFRCNYYPPFPLVILGNKNYVVVYDYDMEQVSRIKSEENIFNFLLVDEIDLEKHFHFESAIDQGSVLMVTLYHSLTERRSQINFNKDTKQIKMIKIFEDNNVITLEFAQVNKVVSFDDSLFTFKNPDIFGPPARFTKAEIEKKYILAK
jgi:outer membrane lipoprotein-sorting protein